LTESALPLVGPGVCYFETDKVLRKSPDIDIRTTTGKWDFIKKDKKPIGIMSVNERGKPDGEITEIGLGDKGLTSFDGSGLSALTHLYLYDNKLTTFTGSGLSDLVECNISNNHLTSFDSSGLASLYLLDIHENRLTSFDSSKLPDLRILYLWDNPFHNVGGPAVVLLDGTKEYWIEGKKYDNDRDYKVARVKYLCTGEADKAMEEIGLKGLFDGI
jgi:hypothetical protein